MDAATRFATARAYELLGDFVRAGVHVDEVSASATGQGLTVTISVGPAAAVSPTPPSEWQGGRSRADVIAKLTPAMRDILGVVSSVTPSKVSQIAARLGKQPGGSLRFLCNVLEILDLIRHVKGKGYVLT
jgi:hypothetical protein